MAMIPGGVNQAAQIAQQAAKPEQVAKTGASKFDQAMSQKVDQTRQAGQVQNVQQVQNAQNVQKTQHVDGVTKAGKVDELKQANAVKHNAPVAETKGAEKPRMALEQILTDMEGRSSAMDKFVNQAVSGKIKLNQQQLLGLQAKVSQYSLELDLTGKVVEKATNGMKETLRTQV